MTFVLEVFTLGLVLSADSFSAAVAMGGRRFSTADLLKFALVSGGAEAISTLIGHLAGARIVAQFSEYDHWIAFGLLAAVALHMALEGVRGLRGADEGTKAFHSLSKIIVVSLATSMDAFGVGIGLGVAERPVWPFVGSIACWAFAATVVGLYVGKRISRKLGPMFTLLAAAVLGFLSLQMLKI